MTDDPDYQRAHWLVWKDRGPACNYSCIRCGKKAEHWAYAHESETSFKTKEGWPFSFDPEDYDPLCRSCHRSLDMGTWSEELEAAVRVAQSQSGDEQMGKRRRKCAECDVQSHPAGIGRHHKASGHRGWEEGALNMRVNVYETVEIDDEQRVRLANVLDGEIAKPKRNATRDEIKEFVWEHGAGWAQALTDFWERRFASEEEDSEEVKAERAAKAAALAAQVEAVQQEDDDEDFGDLL